MGKLLTSSRYIILLAVLGSLLASLLVLGFGCFELFHTTSGALQGGFDAKKTTHEFIEIIDVFLIGTVLYLVAIGLYELFIDNSLVLPPTLRIESLEDLKDKLLGVIVLSLAVLFLGEVANCDDTQQIFFLGAGIALVIVALTSRFGREKH